MDEDSPYAVPRSEVEDVSQAGQLASRGSRLGAVILDGLINTLLYLPFYELVLDKYFPTDAGPFEASLATLLSGLWSMLCFGLVNIQFIQASGQTIGKRLVGIRVVADDGSPASLQQQLKRYGFQYGVRLLPYVGGLISLVDPLLIFRDSRRCLHDDIAGTKVVNN